MMYGARTKKVERSRSVELVSSLSRRMISFESIKLMNELSEPIGNASLTRHSFGLMSDLTSSLVFITSNQ